MHSIISRSIFGLAGFFLLCSTVSAQTTVFIEVTGVDPVLETNVRLYLSLEQQRSSELLTASQIQRFHRKAEKEIAAALQPFGYYQVRVNSSLKRNDDDSWLATYNIEPGQPLTVDSFNFTISGEMQYDPEFERQIKPNQPLAGSVFSHVDYENFKASLGRLAIEHGYFQAKFTQHRVEIDLATNMATVYLDYASGPRYRFGELKLTQTVLDDQLLRRYMTFKPGDPYSLDQLLAFQQALNDTEYFEVAEVTPGQAPLDINEIPITLRLTPRKQHLFKIGLGYGTDTGARTKFGWQIPRINPQGHHFDAELGVSEIGHRVISNYRIPVLNPRTDHVVFSAGEEREKFETGTSNKLSVGVSLDHSLGKWREILSLEYQQEDFSIDNDEETSNLLLPGISWSRTWGQEFINVLDGVRLDLNIRGANTDLASDTDFLQYGISLKIITSLGPRDRVIIRGATATIDTDDFDEIPSSIRYYAGGANSVRGYAYQSLGPTDDDGDAIGAKNLLVGSIEYEHYFNHRWGMALFVDVGNALDDFNDNLEQGAGIGLRWKSPVGPVRIDLANAITGNEDWRLHINIGPDL